jgi:Periplasmic protease
LPQIEGAQIRQDFNGYYLSLRAYLNEIPDGHVRINNLKEIDDLYIGGGYGLAIADSSDQNIIISWVDPASQAWAAGLRPGYEVVSWNGQPIRAALAQTETLLAGTSATTEYLNLKKLAYLVRGAVGQPVEIGYLAPDGASPATVALVAYDDGGLSLKKNYPDAVVSNKLRDMFVGVDNPDPVPKAMVESQMVADQISYVKILGELDADLQETGELQSSLDLLSAAVVAARQNGSRGLIVDLRNNIGGLDQMAADMLGFFL